MKRMLQFTIDAAKVLLLVLAIAVLTTGCATWTHPYKGAPAFERDAYECQREAAAVQDPYRALEMQKACLRLRGWRTA